MRIEKKIIVLLTFFVVFTKCNSDKKEARLKSIQLEKIKKERKSDSILKVDLKRAKIPFEKEGINKELLTKYLSKQIYKNYIFSDRKVYKHESNKKIYKIIKIKDYYQLRQYNVGWDT